ncbi:MAG: insulinase family protein [Candidatus Aminicenantia bacterium]
MKKLFNYLFLILIIVFLLTSQGLAQKSHKELKFPPLKEIKMPKVERVKLPNGMKLLLVEDHELPLIEASAMIKVGSKYEPADKVGLASITGEVMRTGGTKTRTGDQIDEELESIAARVETWISTSSGRAYLSVLKEDIDKGLSVLADILMNPVFDEDKIELSKVQHRSMITRRNDDPMSLTRGEFIRLIYGKEHPYGRIEEYETINNITRDDLIAFHKKYFHPNNVILSVWGDFKTKDMISKIKRAFKDWKPVKIDFPEEPKVSEELIPSVNLIKKDDVNQTNINIGHLGGRMDDPDYSALRVLTEILGGAFSSRLFRHVRSDQGLAYAVWGVYGANYDYPGMFYTGCSTKSESTCQAIEAIIKEIKKITNEEVSGEELKLAKDSILNSFVFNFDTKREIIERLMTYEYYGYPSDFLQRYKENIEKVTKADILRVAKKYIHPDKLIILAVGNDKDFDRPLSEFGEVNEIDITIPEPTKEKIPEASEEEVEKGEEILKEIIQTSGGLKQFKKIKDVVIDQETKVTTPQGEFEIKGRQIILYPDKLRDERTLPFGEIVTVLNGDTGWMKTPQGIQDMPESIVKTSQESLARNFILLLINALKEEYKIQSLPSEEIEGKKAEVILIIDPKGKSVKLVVDPATRLIWKKSYQGKLQAGPVNIEEIFSDYREVNGLKVPFQIVVYVDSKKFSETKVTQVVINSGVSESLFEKPIEEKN